MDDDAIRRIVRSQPIPDRLIRNLRRAQHVDERDIDRVSFRLEADIPLERREIDVLRAMGDGGLTRREAADTLGCSVDTIMSTLKTAKAKLGGAKTTTQAVTRAIRLELI